MAVSINWCPFLGCPHNESSESSILLYYLGVYISAPDCSELISKKDYGPSLYGSYNPTQYSLVNPYSVLLRGEGCSPGGSFGLQSIVKFMMAGALLTTGCAGVPASTCWDFVSGGSNYVALFWVVCYSP